MTKTLFPVTDRALNTLKLVMDKQDDFGMGKYGKPLDHKHNYSWLEMFMEEMADGLKYIQCEIDVKVDVIDLLEKAIRTNNMSNVCDALTILKREGTGK